MPDTTYSHGHGDGVLRSHRWRTAANSAAYLLPHLSPGDTVLDVGCGPGTITCDLARAVSPGPVVGVDAAEAVVAEARERAVGVPGVTFEVADLFALPYADDSFDVVHAHQVLQHVADPVAVLRAMAARCAPGGLVAARDGDYSAFAWFPRLPELDRWLALYRQAARANGGEPDAGPRLAGWARQAGLTDVTTTASTWCFATDDDRAWWGGMWAERILSSALTRQLLDTGLSTQTELAEISAAWRRWAADTDGVFFVTHGEILCRVSA